MTTTYKLPKGTHVIALQQNVDGRNLNPCISIKTLKRDYHITLSEVPVPNIGSTCIFYKFPTPIKNYIGFDYAAESLVLV